MRAPPARTMPRKKPKPPPKDSLPEADEETSSAMTVAAILLLAREFPHRQFNSNELSIISGLGRTAMSQIKNSADTPFSLGKCTMARLDAWLEKHPGFKQRP